MKTPSLKELLESEMSDMYAAEVSRGTINEVRANLLHKEALKRVRVCFEHDADLPFHTVNIPKELISSLAALPLMDQDEGTELLLALHECIMHQMPGAPDA